MVTIVKQFHYAIVPVFDPSLKFVIRSMTVHSRLVICKNNHNLITTFTPLYMTYVAYCISEKNNQTGNIILHISKFLDARHVVAMMRTVNYTYTVWQQSR